MGTTTLATFKTDLTLELGQRDDISSYTAAWINRAYLTLTCQNKIWGIKNKFYFPQLETFGAANTGDGDPYISTPTDCIVVRTVWDSTNDNKLTKISWLKYIGYAGRATSTSEGKPDEWVRHADDSGNDKIYLYKTPDAIYAMKIYYRKRPAILTGSNTTVIGAEWDEPLLQLAAIQSHNTLGEYDKADRKKKEWISVVSGMLGLYEQEDEDREDVRRPHTAYLNFEY